MDVRLAVRRPWWRPRCALACRRGARTATAKRVDATRNRSVIGILDELDARRSITGASDGSEREPRTPFRTLPGATVTSLRRHPRRQNSENRDLLHASLSRCSLRTLRASVGVWRSGSSAVISKDSSTPRPAGDAQVRDSGVRLAWRRADPPALGRTSWDAATERFSRSGDFFRFPMANRIMFPRQQQLLIWLAVGMIPLLAQEMAPVSVRGIEGFKSPESLLRQLVLSKRGGAANNFCIVGYKDSSGALTAWVHWVEGKALILWEPSQEGAASLIQSRRYLDLRRDVVATEEHVNGSTYLVTRSWVNHILSDCKSTGDRYFIRRTVPRARRGVSKNNGGLYGYERYDHHFLESGSGTWARAF